ncbi:MAG TPA: hypothetical protein VEJ63_03330 [Planctomycetota bacterium]|nr:hypothetical protein [Planctomycetota bacterium]
MSRNVWSICLIVALASVGARAAAENPTDRGANKDAAQTQFDNRIDTWMEGTIVTLDADGGKFSVRGVKMPYATAYAEMMKDIHDKTQNVDAKDRQAKAEEVRKAWADRLAKSRNEKVADNPSDFNFAVTEKNALRVMSDKNLQGADFLTAKGAEGAAATEVAGQKNNEQAFEATAGNKRGNRDNVAGDEREVAAMMAFKDLKVGDKVMVGYDGGMVSNTAYTVIKREGGDHKGAGAKHDAKQHEAKGAQNREAAPANR